jgi:hypothetical protein
VLLFVIRKLIVSVALVIGIDAALADEAADGRGRGVICELGRTPPTGGGEGLFANSVELFNANRAAAEKTQHHLVRVRESVILAEPDFVRLGIVLASAGCRGQHLGASASRAQRPVGLRKKTICSVALVQRYQEQFPS